MYPGGDNLRLQAIFSFSCLVFIAYFLLYLLLISGAEDIQKRLDISLEVCSAT